MKSVTTEQIQICDLRKGDRIILYTENLGRPHLHTVREVHCYTSGDHRSVEVYLRDTDLRLWQDYDYPILREVS